MKNIGLSFKVAMLVALLLITVAIVVAVGVVQLQQLDTKFDNMVNTTGRAIQLSGDGRIALLSSIRAEKNAVLVPDRVRAESFAAHAREELAKVKASATGLEATFGGDGGTPEARALADFGRAIDEFEKNQVEVLRLAVQKSNTEGSAMLFGDLNNYAREFADFVRGMSDAANADVAAGNRGEPAAASQNVPTSVQGAGRLVIGRIYELLFKLAMHMASADEQQMNLLDAEIKQDMSEIQAALRRFNLVLSDAERLEAASGVSNLDAIKPKVARVLQLSHENSDVHAREQTVTQTVTLANRCDGLLTTVRDALKNRLAAEAASVTAAAKLGRNIVVSTGAIGAVLSLILAIGIIRSITQPVKQGVEVFEAIAAGDLTRRLNLDRHDEIGRLGIASDQMAGVMCGVVTQIRNVAGRLGNAAGDLNGVSTDLLSQSQQMTTQAESVAAGTEQMSTNVATMAAAAEEMSVNVAGISSASEEVSVNVASIVESADATSRSVGSVAESIEQITVSLQDVARDARHGSQMTQQARDMAAAATAAMRQLDQAASEINKVTDVIKSIALQTNLLALNATIEATSAGEAGKGFAVVAGEVKELASQSAHSAEEIARRIESVQTSTRDAVKVIDNVAQFISQVNVTAERISESVDGQTQTAGQIVSAVAQARRGVESIARSIAEVAKGATDVSRNTAEASHAATDVSRNASEAAKAAETISVNIHGVSDATRENSASAVKVNEAAKLLKELAEQLQKGVVRFKVGDDQSLETHA